MNNMNRISLLPYDILEEIISVLDVKDFLALSSTSRQFRTIVDDPVYWKNATIDNFRVRNRPSTDNDGILWRKLYKRLRTQTRIFMWGQASLSGNPEQIDLGVNGGVEPGIISDLQCGGWCTVFLNNRGELFLQGKINGESFNARGVNHTFGKLKFPDSATDASQISIRQFSAGRKHILGLADDGTVWLWYAAALPAKKIEFHEKIEGDNAHKLNVSHVMAGWSTSAMYIRGKGIIFWEYVDPLTIDASLNPDFGNEELKWVPRSGFVTRKSQKFKTAYGKKIIDSSNEFSLETEQEKSEGDFENSGEVVSFALLEHHLIFCTDKGQLLVHKHGTEVSLRAPELNNVADVQGTFRSFAVFQKDGTVSIVEDSFLDRAFENSNAQIPEDLRPATIPALQNSGVIQVAFGDYHFHALHSNGRITSYGKDPKSSGALGLGRLTIEQPFSARGFYNSDQAGPWISDAVLFKQALLREGRAVWFHPQQKAWADSITAALNASSPQTIALGQLEVSEWVEQQGTGWDEGEDDEDGLGAYFALSVAAGGWRGGALVLVNQALVDKQYSCFAPRQTLPNIMLAGDNGLLLGEGVPEDQWKTMPTWS
jgi:SCF-associated factor 1